MPALLLPNEILSMSAQAARRLVEAGEGECALLYLALLDGNDAGKAQRALHWGDEHFAAVYGKLTSMGLAAEENTPAPAKKEAAEELPRYSREDVVNALEREPEFCGLYREVERLLGRQLSDAALEVLYTIYDGLAMPPEVILLLVSYVTSNVRRQQKNEGATPKISQIKSEAFRWKRLGLDTVEAVDAYIRRQMQVDRREWAILSAVGVTEQRPAVERERSYINSWVELGFSDELIAKAYAETVYQKGQMNWPYMNKVLLNWNQEGWRTPEQVDEGKKNRRRPTGADKPKKEDYQPTAQRIRESGDWLDQFLSQQEKER